MIKDPKTGAVLVTDKIKKLSEQDMADVIHACPYNIPRYDKVKKTLAKCDMCADRVAAGMLPACVKTCPTGAMVFGEPGRDPGPCQKAAGGRQKDSSQGIPGRS